MESMFADFSSFDKFYLACAVIGGTVLIVRLVLQFMVGDVDADHAGTSVDIDVAGVDVHVDGIDLGHADAQDADISGDSSDYSFKILSLHSMSAFFSMFGLVGLALSRQSRADFMVSLFGAMAAGVVAVWVIGKLFMSAVKLQSSGTLSMANAVGSEGTVYLSIPEGGTGRVTVKFQHRMMELSAVAADGLEIPTGTPVKVLSVGASNILSVKKIQGET